MRIAAFMLATSLCLASFSVAAAQEFTPFDKLKDEAELSRTIAALDTAVFDAYNRCDQPGQLARFGSFFTDDVEFYHDQTGLAVGKDKLLVSIKQNICGKVQRTLVPGTLQAHPLAHFGAVELATHRFHQPHNPDNGVGEAETVMIWKWQDNAWKISRVISYDHHPAPKKIAGAACPTSGTWVL